MNPLFEDPPRAPENGVCPSGIKARAVTQEYILRVILTVIFCGWLWSLSNGTRRFFEVFHGTFSTSVVLLIVAFFLTSAIPLYALFKNRLHVYRRATWVFLIVGLTLFSVYGIEKVIGLPNVDALYLGDLTSHLGVAIAVVFPVHIGLPLGVITIAGGMIADYGIPRDIQSLLVQINAVFLAAPFIVATVHGIRTTRFIDKQLDAVWKHSLQVSCVNSLVAAENRFLSFVHDDVFPYLMAYANRFTAEKYTIEDHFSATPEASESVPLAEMIAMLRRLDPSIPITVQADGDPRRILLPGPVAEGFITATAQAIRNSELHAPSASRRVVVRARNSYLAIDIRDAGNGFDLSEVVPNNVGLRVSVIERLASVGGSAKVISAEGKGTRILLRWSPTPEKLHEAGKVVDLRMGVLLHPLTGVVFSIYTCVLAFVSSRAPQLGWRCVSLGAFIFASTLIFRRGKTFTPRWLIGFLLLVAFWAGYLEKSTILWINWPEEWFRWPFIILLIFLALCSELLLAWGTLAALFTGLFIFHVPNLLYMDFILTAVIVASLVPFIMARAQKALLNISDSDFEVASNYAKGQAEAYTRDLMAWVQAQLDAVTTPEEHRLLELRLRDAIKSPVLLHPEIVEAVWQARARGATITLRDRLSTRFTDSMDPKFLEKINQPQAFRKDLSLFSASNSEIDVPKVVAALRSARADVQISVTVEPNGGVHLDKVTGA
ncbi:hypothetical protein I6J21_02815 [Corynebacterium glucuronolyticum]|uniref:Signal transduction histidine kinase n=2 Tax=Corynebacterium glucuronolyticum TaxID=39791 RepID=A0AAX1L9I2_9CORY|nr:hypothetical protein [Corynebacterium glucuronolyticum]QRP71106.1 hypothetical protein I6J21_02815 [Corynebacterium glucuronolyticum]